MTNRVLELTVCNFPNCNCSMGAAERCGHPLAMGDSREAAIRNEIARREEVGYDARVPLVGPEEYADLTAALSRPVQEPVAQIEFARGTAGRENEMPRVVSCNWLPDGVYSVYASPQPAHGTSATERVVYVDVRGIETSIDTMREAAWNLLVKQGWKPGSQLSGHSAVGLMAEFGMRVYRGEVGCDYPSCGCCADAACQDAVSQHPDLGGTLPASTPEVKPMEWTVFCSRSGNSQAETPLGQYVLQYEGLGFGDLWMLYLPYKDTSTGKGYETIDAAKAAAQADYEHRIRSALATPTPKTEAEAN